MEIRRVLVEKIIFKLVQSLITGAWLKARHVVKSARSARYLFASFLDSFYLDFHQSINDFSGKEAQTHGNRPNTRQVKNLNMLSAFNLRR